MAATDALKGRQQQRQKKRRNERLEEQLRDVNWRELTFVGTELANVAVMRREPFSFPALSALLCAPNGALRGLPHPVYIFAVSEPVYLRDAETIFNVPVLVALRSAAPPPSLVCHDSVQSTDASARALNPLGGRPQPMRAQQLAWVPYVPQRLRAAVADAGLDRGAVRFPVVALTWEGRESRTKRMSEAQVHYVEYLNPYIVLPRVVDALEKPEVCNVDFVWTAVDANGDAKKIDVVFDKEIDRLAEFVPDMLEKHKLPEEAGKALEQAIRDAFKRARALADEQWEELQQRIRDMSEAERKALTEAKLYKIYPSHPDHDLRPYLSPRINRYYGNADFVVGGDPLPQKAPAAAEDVQGEPAAKRSRK